MKNYRIIRHESKTCWLIYADNELFTTRPTRREAREVVRQEQALNRESKPVPVEIAWKD